MDIRSESGLPPLLRKAAGDAGFDLSPGHDGEWERLGVSGVEGSVWVMAEGSGALLAIDSAAVLRDFEPHPAAADLALPRMAVGAVRCISPEALYEALRRARVLLAQAPPRPARRFQERLDAISKTEVDAVVRQRVGQDLFREMLLDYWDGRCAVSGLSVPELLRASHAKPWRDASDAERLDVHNGFLLAVHLDALFDQGWMTFRDDGWAEFSPLLDGQARECLIGGVPVRLCRVAGGHRPHLAYHREHVFRAGTT